jgi:hypothetical protein
MEQRAAGSECGWLSPALSSGETVRGNPEPARQCRSIVASMRGRRYDAGMPDSPPPHGRGLPLTESIAVGAILALVAWGVITLSGHAADPVPLGPLDPGRLFPGRSLTLGDLPLVIMLFLGGVPLVWDLVTKLLRGTFGSDLLAGLSIVTSIVLGEYLAGVLVVLMLSGGEALESRAVSRAGDVLNALARRMPTLAHRKLATGFTDVALSEVAVGDVIVVLPHEICPVDGTVVAGRGSMDESYLTGEPYRMAKAPGSAVLSGAINGQAALEVSTERVAGDSRYAKIMEVLKTSEERRPPLRRLADSLGAFYTPLAVAIALAAWWASGEATRFLAVLVVATPCPLLIAIPVAIIGAVSLAAKRGIVIRILRSSSGSTPAVSRSSTRPARSPTARRSSRRWRRSTAGTRPISWRLPRAWKRIPNIHSPPPWWRRPPIALCGCSRWRNSPRSRARGSPGG